MKHQLFYIPGFSQIRINRFLLPVAMLLSSMLVYGQDGKEETGLPGDHFSLEGALELFKNSQSPEDFEKKLNSEESKVNNLDLNEDGEIDYIRVIDHMDKDVHALVMTVPLNENETQDIAVIEIEKTGESSAILQIIGDEDVYGEQVIVEPYSEENEGTNKGSDDFYRPVVVTVNVFGWSSVRYMYRPSYVVWASPWRYRYYPNWWKSWRPLSWHVWHPIRISYRPHYRVVTTHRVVRAHRVYVPKRKTTTVVASRTKVVRSKTVVTNPGNKVVGSKTTTTVAGKTTDGKAAVVTKSSGTVAVKSAEGQKTVANKTNTKVAAKSADGQKMKASQSTTKVKAKGKNGTKVAGKKTTTKAKAKGKKGNVAGTKTSKTKVKKKKNG